MERWANWGQPAVPPDRERRAVGPDATTLNVNAESGHDTIELTNLAAHISATLSGGTRDDSTTVDVTEGAVLADGGPDDDEYFVRFRTDANLGAVGPVAVDEQPGEGTDRVTVLGTAVADTINITNLNPPDEIQTGGRVVRQDAVLAIKRLSFSFLSFSFFRYW